MKFVCLLLCLLAAAAEGSVTNTAPLDLILVVGASGEKEFEAPFSEAADNWIKASEASRRTYLLIDGRSSGTNQLQALENAIATNTVGASELWVVLIGHGTFDGREAKFNLQGPDFSATNAARVFSTLRRPLVFINASAASAPFLTALSTSNRIVVTATKSGWEENYARFGNFFAKSILNLEADLDKDGQVSLLEAFLNASRQTEEFYKSEKRLATEHALLDDNGDGKGTPASFFRGIRPAGKPDEDAQVDGLRAHQVHFLQNETEANLSPEWRARRNELELQLENLRRSKGKHTEEEYLRLIEPVLLELSRLYETTDTGKKPES